MADQAIWSLQHAIVVLAVANIFHKLTNRPPTRSIRTTFGQLHSIRDYTL